MVWNLAPGVRHSRILGDATNVVLMDKEAKTLNDGFRLHDCEVHPVRNVVVGPDGEHHLEPKAMQVLLVLAAHAGEVVPREKLLDEVWPRTFTGDTALTRCISLLRAALGEGSDRGRFIETVSKSGYRLTADVVAVGATPSPMEETVKTPRSAPGRRLLAWEAAGVVGLALLLWFWPSTPPKTASEEPAAISETVYPQASDTHAIAVLPFANMSGDPANDYFSDGISEEILNVLAQIPRLRVTSRSSSFAFRNSEIPLSEVAGRLGVKSILEGSVRKFDDRVRISVQLVNAGDDSMLWSETYDRAFDDLFEVQEDIALSVAQTLKIALDIDETEAFESQRRLTPIARVAHEAYLRGRYLTAQRTRRALEEAVDAFEQAIAIEPGYAEAMAQLAITYLLLTRRNYGNLSEAEAMSHARGHAEVAMRLAPGSAESLAAAGMVSWRLGQSKVAEDQFLRALEINPNYAMVHHWLSMLQYRNLGKHEASLESSKIARKLDPVSIPILSIHFSMLLVRGFFDEAIEELKNLESISPSTYHRIRAYYAGLDGAWADNLLANLDALMVDPDSTRTILPIKTGLVFLGLDNEVTAFGPVTRVSMLRYLGRTEDAVRMAEEDLREDSDSVWAQQSLARALVSNGETRRAATLLEGLWEKSDHRVSLVTRHFFTLREILPLREVRVLDGDMAGANELLRAIRTEVENLRSAGITVTRRLVSVDFSEGIALYLGGQEDEGLRLIRQAVEDGYVLRGREHGFHVGDLFEDPRFDPILQIHRATQARERARLLAIVCDNNPYASVWRPSAETCTGSE